MKTNIKPHGDNVLVEIQEGEQKIGSIIVPQKAKDNMRDLVVAKVLAVGPGRTSEYGARMEVHFKEGDFVLIGRTAGHEVRSADTKMRILRDVEIFGSVEESRILTFADVPPVGRIVT